MEMLFQLKANGTGIVYISHRMDELKRLADRVTVLRDGSYIGSLERDEISIPKIIEMMVGRAIDEGARPTAREHAAELVLREETTRLNRALQREVFSKEALKALQEPLITLFFAFGLYAAMSWWQIPLATIITMAFILVKILKTLQNAQKEHQSMVIAESAYWSLQAKIEETQREREECAGGIAPRFAEAVRLEGGQFCLCGAVHPRPGVAGRAPGLADRHHRAVRGRQDHHRRSDHPPARAAERPGAHR